MLPAGFSLLAGLDAALLLLGLPAPVTAARLPETHGVLLVIGFVGTLIALERATALRRWYGFAAPALLGIGGILLVADPVPLGVAKGVLIAGTAAFSAVYIPLWRRRYDAQLLVQLMAAVFALAAMILWAGGADMSWLLPWLFAFVVLTIAAERVELAFTLGPNAGAWILVHASLIAVALLIGLADAHVGAVALGIAFLLLVGWLIRHDVARRTIRARGATRYMAACMLGGYLWLTVAGVILLFGFPIAQPAYDAVAHAIFLGFTISMIMAHATTILPAVLHIALPYRPAFWVPAVLLHLSLVVRLWLGDGLGARIGFTVGGVLGVAALLLFVLTAVTSAIMGPPRPAVARAEGSPGAPARGPARGAQIAEEGRNA